MHLQLGKVATLVISSPEMAKEVLGTHDLVCCSRPLSEGPRRLSYDFKDIAFAPYTDYLKAMRKICVAEPFNTKRVKSFRSVREQEVASYIKSISQAFPNLVNLSEKVFYLVDAITCRTSCGRNYEGKQFRNGKHEEVIKEAMTVLASFSGEDFFQFGGRMIDIFTGVHAQRENSFHIFDQFYQKVIDDHLDPNCTKPEHEDIVDVLLGLWKDHTVVRAFGKDHIKAILMNILLGTIYGTTITIVWALTELAKNPRIMKVAQAEIISRLGTKLMVEESDLDNFQYLKMVFKETLRLHPPSMMSTPRETVAHCKIGGYDVYPKTRIHINVWAMGRDPRIWDNPEEFNPERFMNSDINFRGQHFELLPLGDGRRLCPGIDKATTIMELTLANLLYSFDWRLPSGMRMEEISTEEGVGPPGHKRNPFALFLSNISVNNKRSEECLLSHNNKITSINKYEVMSMNLI